MKKIICIFISFAITLPFLAFAPVRGVKAFGGEAYRRVITETTPFYADKAATQLLFYLPYTYYVKVLSADGAMTRVEVYGTGATAALDGYVPAEMLYNDGLEVKNPFVNLEIITSATAILYGDAALTSTLQYVFPSRGLRYYGFIYAADGSKLYYVGYNNRLGYVRESEITPFVIPDHPNELTFIPKPTEPIPTPNEDTKPSEADGQDETAAAVSLRAVIIVCLIFAGVIALFIAFKTKPPQKKQSYYDENDYE